MKITEESNDEETDYTEDTNKNDDDSIDSDYDTKRKRKVYNKFHSQNYLFILNRHIRKNLNDR